MGLLRESHFFVLEIKRWQWKMLNHLPTATFFYDSIVFQFNGI